MRRTANLVLRVSLLPVRSERGGGQKRDPGNEVNNFQPIPGWREGRLPCDGGSQSQGGTPVPKMDYNFVTCDQTFFSILLVFEN